VLEAFEDREFVAAAEVLVAAGTKPG
jgi:hypothetical protein